MDRVTFMHETIGVVISAPAPARFGGASFRSRNCLGSFRVSTSWGPEAGASLRAYVLQHAANADKTIATVADLSRATGIKPGIYSKWFRGVEQPSVGSLERLAPIIKAPLAELLVLACRVS